VLELILPTDSYDEMYVQRNPILTGIDTTPYYSEKEVNTERVVMKNTSMQPVEGGWSKEVDFTSKTASSITTKRLRM
jgi:hypothetical protein